MKRKEEISKAAEKELKDCPYINTSLIGFDFFIKGAEWADSHPIDTTIDWEHRRYEIAKAALSNPALVYTEEIGPIKAFDIDKTVKNALKAADKLIKELKGVKQ